MGSLKIAVGFDTSCYTTSVAACDENGEIIASLRQLLPVPPMHKGLRQSEAVFAHVRQLPELVVTRLKAEIGSAEICAVAASAAPTDAAGELHARVYGRAEFRHVACEPAGRSVLRDLAPDGAHPGGADRQSAACEPFVALHVSGGTTESLLCEGETITPLGRSLDLHAGQLVDRIGVANWASRFPRARRWSGSPCRERPKRCCP